MSHNSNIILMNSFRRFLDDGHVEMHNIAAERMFRHIAMGRRNWMHVGSHGAAENISFVYSLLESYKLNDLSFGDYIEDICGRIMRREKDFESLLPCDYKDSKSVGSEQPGHRNQKIKTTNQDHCLRNPLKNRRTVIW